MVKLKSSPGEPSEPSCGRRLNPVRSRKPRSKAEHCRAGRARIREQAVVARKYKGARRLAPVACGKVAYGDQVAAQSALRSIQSVGEVREKVPIRAYYCPRCGFWHLTSQVAAHGAKG